MVLKYLETQIGFKIEYEHQEFFIHSRENPLIFLGMGSNKVRMYYGEFRIRDKISERTPLRSYELIFESEKEITVLLSEQNLSLQLSFKIEENRLIIIPTAKDPEINRFWLKINANAEEAVYGCGAQYSKFNLRGQAIKIWIQEEMLGEKSYFLQPTFISSECYYCHVETTAYTECNFQPQNYHEIYLWGIPEKIIIYKDENLLSVVSNLTKYLGFQPRFPDWVYDGIILGIQGGKEVVDKKLSIAEEFGIKVVGAWCQDWEGQVLSPYGKLVFYNWVYDKSLYPQLSRYIQSLNKRNVKFLGYINPFLNVEGNLYKIASEKNYCVKNQNGEDYYINMGAFAPALLDLTNPAAVKWIKTIIKENMIKIGLDGWMMDYGEYLPLDAALYSGEDPKLIHNKYAVDWIKIGYECLQETKYLDYHLIFTRAGYSHFSKYTMLYWPGDQIVNWSPIEGLPTVIPSGISCGMCGIGNYHFDIGGFSAHGEIKRSRELFMRWAEIAAFSMVMRTHEGNKPKDNWQFDSDEETLTHLARMVTIHINLKPYLKLLEMEYQDDGIPPIRACILHYERDLELKDMKYQYLLGRELLIAPVIEPSVFKWKVYLPDDSWIHLWSGDEFKQGWWEVEAPLGKPPVFYLKDSRFKKLFERLKYL